MTTWDAKLGYSRYSRKKTRNDMITLEKRVFGLIFILIYLQSYWKVLPAWYITRCSASVKIELDGSSTGNSISRRIEYGFMDD